MINVCMICPDALLMFCEGFCHLSIAAAHVFFRMCVVTCASLQSGALANSVFRDLVISLSPGIVYLMMPYVHVVS